MGEETVTQTDTTRPSCHVGRSDRNQRTVLESLFPEGPWRIAHIRTLFLHILPTIHNLWTVFHPAEALVTPPLVSFVMVDDKPKLQQAGQGDGEGQRSSGSRVAAARWLSMQGPLLSLCARAKASPQ